MFFQYLWLHTVKYATVTKFLRQQQKLNCKDLHLPPSSRNNQSSFADNETRSMGNFSITCSPTVSPRRMPDRFGDLPELRTDVPPATRARASATQPAPLVGQQHTTLRGSMILQWNPNISYADVFSLDKMLPTLPKTILSRVLQKLPGSLVSLRVSSEEFSTRRLEAFHCRCQYNFLPVTHTQPSEGWAHAVWQLSWVPISAAHTWLPGFCPKEKQTALSHLKVTEENEKDRADRKKKTAH